MKYLLLIAVFITEAATDLLVKEEPVEIKNQITSENRTEPYQFEFLVSEV